MDGSLGFGPDAAKLPGGSLIGGKRVEGRGAEIAVQRSSDAKVVAHFAGAIRASSINKALMTAGRIEAGMIWVNTYGRSLDVGSPFGGYKHSGFGKDFGAAAFEKYLDPKSVWIQLR